MIQVYAVMGIGRRRQVTSQVMGSYGDITKALQGIASWESLEKIASPNHPYDVYSFASELPALAKARKANEQSWASVHESDVFMTAADELALVL